MLLIDDEQNALDYLEKMLRPHKDIQIMGKHKYVDTAIEQLSREPIDLVFLDIEMGFYHGIEVAEKLVGLHPNLEIVFVTAYAEFAVEAFGLGATDYLLKPVNAGRLKEAVKRARERILLNQGRQAETLIIQNGFSATTFGKFYLYDEQDTVVKWRTRKGRELVALLWKQRGRPIDKERIIETLWPEMVFDNAVKLLYTTVYQVRQALGGKGRKNAISLVGEDYQLDITIVNDYDDLQQLLTSPKIPVNIERSLALYEDNFLREYDWAEPERYSLENAFLLYLEECIFDRSVQLTPALKEACLEKMIQIDPLHEKTVLELISFYSAAGNLAKMNALYGHYKKELGELNLEESPSFARYVSKIASEVK